MSDPRRLRDEVGFGRGLLESAEQDRPPSDARKKAALALGIVGPIVPPVGSAPAGAGTAAPATIAKVIGAKIGASTIMPLALAAVVGGGGIWAATRPADEPAPAPIVAPARVVLAPPVAEAPIQAAPIVEPPIVEAPSEAAPKPRRRAPITAEIPLSREIELLDAARASLKASNADETAAALDRYRAECPTGRLVPEAELIEIDRRLLAGDRNGAAEAAWAYRSRYGDRLPPRHRALLSGVP